MHGKTTIKMLEVLLMKERTLTLLILPASLKVERDIMGL
jgi:hypothetical protein